ncbi:ECF transporter S component [Limosilactobacillus reuteri]|uniref:ECF transporter S component n=1 Tax=Limosilactobacillus reuteri TaxID=1598 RepID=UPI001E3AC312|nr:ECF transporter S component [Limosilactobacillus reuteri]MCC4466638.1 ECF transporter S component [Limosilactobacillus reuteri]MCC4474333.1 ECF transporter S component [Limosilactobacillus reuteri]MCT3188433.1 hypothetical protein [Limosilactobacillus reuteri]MCT3196153.1 hypothetical protein [Limosilactobacillus reuteri]
MESTFRLRRSIIAAMLLALTLVLGRFFLIPIPWTHGNINLCDAGVFIAAMLLGPGAGTIVMIAIYFICNTVMYHVITGFLSLGSNFIQGMIGGIVALIVIRQLKKHHIG